MTLESLRSALHVVIGPSAGGILNQTLHLFRDRRLLVGEEPLALGPAPATDDLDLWRAMREPFIDAIYRTSGMEFSFDGYADIGLLMNATRLRNETEIIVWVATGLEDQLLLAWAVFLCDRLNVDVSRLRIIQFEMIRSTWRAFSMGEVAPEVIRAECPALALSAAPKQRNRAAPGGRIRATIPPFSSTISPERARCRSCTNR